MTDSAAWNALVEMRGWLHPTMDGSEWACYVGAFPRAVITTNADPNAAVAEAHRLWLAQELAKPVDTVVVDVPKAGAA